VAYYATIHSAARIKTLQNILNEIDSIGIQHGVHCYFTVLEALDDCDTPSATADGTDLLTRRSRLPKVTKRRQVAALQKSRHLSVMWV
jgi:hypothetical protein